MENSVFTCSFLLNPFMSQNRWIGMNRTTSTPISVLSYDVDKDLLRAGIQHLPFQLFQEIKVEDKS